MRGFRQFFPAERLKAWRDRFPKLDGNQRICETTVRMLPSLLLADRGDMDPIIEAIRRIQAHSAALANVA